MKRLFFDIEVSPNVVLAWRTGYKIDVGHDSVVTERAIMTIAWKWEGGKVQHLTWDKDQNDKKMLQEFVPILNEADETVAHFGDGFDLPWVKARCLFHGIPTLPLYKTVDTCKLAQKNFLFNSNKLDYLSKFLGFGGKIRTDFQLWKDILLKNCSKSLKAMVEYNKKDVILLEKVWKKISEAVPASIHAGVLAGGERWTCPKDGSRNVILSKTRVTAKGAKQYQMRCQDCGSYFSISDAVHKQYQKAKG